jgi:phospholipid/cholesterol/gamma-HCH transport system substrate-binding protein
MMRICLRRMAIGLLVVFATAGPSGCGWRGLNSIPLPGPDVDNIEQNSRVRVGDVTVGNVTKIEGQGWHALVTMTINGDVNLPANATATVGQTSLLGSLHVELAPPANAAPAGKLHDGSVIPLSSGAMYPSTEQTLAAVSLLLNGGGIGQIQDITRSLSTAFMGREDDLRSLIQQLDKFVAYVNDQTDDIVGATDSLNNLVGQFAEQTPVVDKALKTIPDALAALNDQRDNLSEALDQIGKFSALAAESVNQTKENLVKELKDLGPVLESLANAGPALTRSLSYFTTFPYAKETLTKWFRGDYANLTAVVDLTLSRLDSSFFTGTRFEGDLTELELQWGRTIGQMPSPYTAADPLVVPYVADQGP